MLHQYQICIKQQHQFQIYIPKNNLFSLLLRLKLKKFIVLIVYGMICVSVYPIMSLLFIILLLLIISPACFENDFTLYTRTVTASYEIVFLFFVESKWFCFKHSYTSSSFSLTFTFKFPYTKKIIKSFYSAELTIYLPWSK